MTADELRKRFNELFGLNKWPDKYGVDAETYANCCQAVFTHSEESATELYQEDNRVITIARIALGPNNGLMFKNVELILNG